MKMVIVPNCLAETLNAKLDKALLNCPEATKDRGHLYQQLLEYFMEHGTIPDFTIALPSNPTLTPK